MKLMWFAESYTPYNNNLFNVTSGIDDVYLKVVYRNKLDNMHFFTISENVEYNYEYSSNLNIRLILEFMKSDYIIFTGMKSSIRKFLLIYCLILGKKYSFWTDTPPNNYFSGLKGYIKKVFFKLFTLRIDKICTTGVNGINFFKNNSFQNKNIVNLPFFLDLNEPDMFNTNKLTYSGNINENKDFMVCLSGKLVAFKNYEIALNIADELINVLGYSNIKFVLCGEGEERNKYEKIITDKLLQNNFILTGWLDNEKLDYFYKNGNLFLHTSLLDPYPTVVLKAMIYSLPVIGFEGAGSVADRVINDYSGYVIKNNDIKEMTHKIEYLVKNKSIAEEYGKNARKTAEQWNDSNAQNVLRNILFLS
jgi:glycosyltransferase involved in cell wall biosynthesis